MKEHRILTKTHQKDNVEGDHKVSYLLTAVQVSGYLRLSVKTIYNMVSEGRLPCYRINKRIVRFVKEEIDQWLLLVHQKGRCQRIPDLDSVLENKDTR